MSLGSDELYDLFLALAPARIEAARAALDESELLERQRLLESALIPLCVDATMLGADGVSALARAIALAPEASPHDVGDALDTLASSIHELRHGDRSGARVDESRLRELAARLSASSDVEAPSTPRQRQLGVPTPPGSVRFAETNSERDPQPPLRDQLPGGPEGSYLPPEHPTESLWVPSLGEDMIAAFLDECAERADGLSERLLALEESGGHPALIDEIFRDLHTLKGSSAFAGLKKLNRVAHRAEDLIGAMREGRRAMSTAVVDVLLDTLDAIRAIVDRARGRMPIDVDIRRLLLRLEDPDQPAPTIATPMDSSPASVRASRGTSPARSSSSVPASVRSPKSSRPEPRPPRGPEQGAQGSASAHAATLRIDFEKVDQLLNLVGETVLARGRLAHAADAQGTTIRELEQLRSRWDGGQDDAQSLLAAKAELRRVERVLREEQEELDAAIVSLGLAVGQLRDDVMKLRMVPIARLFTKYQRTARQLAAQLGKELRVELTGAETELDKVLVERLEDPLLHLLRNAVDHGIEAPERREATGKPRHGTVRLTAIQRGGQIIVSIVDDGGGMDPAKLRAKAVEKGVIAEAEAATLTDAESFELIFRPGFSTAPHVSDVSGRGVGMDVVRTTIHQLKGTVAVDSVVGRGTTIELRLPLTLAITQVLAVRVGGDLVALPVDAVVSTQQTPTELETIGDGLCLRMADVLVPVLDLASLLGLGQETLLGAANASSIVLVEAGNERLGLLVQRVLGRYDVVIKSLGPLLAGTPCAAGATIIGERVALVVDLTDLGQRARHTAMHRGLRSRPTRAVTKAKVLVAEDSDLVRESIRRELVASGFDVRVAEDGEEALSLARRESFDAVSTDVMMPKMDGYELTRALRREPRYREVPIVMVSSKDTRIDTLRGLDAGADAYLPKPSDASELVRTIDGLLRRGRRTAD